MRESEVGEAVALVARAMTPAEARCARRTMEHHFRCQRHGINDGRAHFVLADRGSIAGLVGLHASPWSPPENVWLSWFAVDPRHQGQGLGTAMLNAATREAQNRNFMKFYIETYSTPEFAHARAFYRAHGFRRVGRIESFKADGGDVVVYYKSIAPGA